MKVTVNGEVIEVEEGKALKDLLAELGEPYTVGLVELNSRLVKRAELQETRLSEGDVVEVVLPAFGG